MLVASSYNFGLQSKGETRVEMTLDKVQFQFKMFSPDFRYGTGEKKSQGYVFIIDSFVHSIQLIVNMFNQLSQRRAIHVL